MTDLELHQFHGGLQPEEHKIESSAGGIQTLALPKQIILPLKQHIGSSNKVLVSVGDSVKRGQLLASSQEMISAPIHASTSGVISAIKQHAVPHASGMSDLCIFIDVDFKDDVFISPSPSKNVDDLSADELLQLIKQAGIVGLGGAAFPTAAKISASKPCVIETLIINGAECEPYISCDDALMQYHADVIIQGIQCLQKIVLPKHTIIGIEDNKKLAIKAMQHALKENPLTNTQIAEVPTLYPSGGEKQLITILTGKEVPSQKLAFDIGIICQNVGTCFAIAEAIDNKPLTSRIVTVSGKGINKPGNFEVRLGTPMTDLIDAAGGYSPYASHLIMGGPMMGFTLAHDQLPIIKSSNALLALHEAFNPQQEAQACIRCGKCAEVCPAQLLPQQLFWYARANSFERIKEYNLFDCIECGCCSAVCPSQIPLVQYYRYAKGEIRIADQSQRNADHARNRFEFREHRLAENKRKLAETRRIKREALAAKKSKPADKTSAEKPALDPIQAALERVKAKQALKNGVDLAPKKNTENLTPDQQRQIDEADQRRKADRASRKS